METAREQLGRNQRRPPSTRALHRFWQLSGGTIRCAICGNGFSTHTVHANGKIRAYYRCYTRYNSGLKDCTNRRSMPAAALEEAVWEAVLAILSDPRRLLRQYEEHVEGKRRQMRGDPDREARTLIEQLQKLERRRGGFLDLAADGDMSREDLRVKLADLDDQRNGLQKSLREAQRRQDSLRESVINFAHLDSLLLQLNRMDLDMASPEDRRRIYGAIRLQVNVDGEKRVRLSGVFDPGVYLPGVLQDAPDVTTPRPEVPKESKVFVTRDSTHRCNS